MTNHNENENRQKIAKQLIHSGLAKRHFHLNIDAPSNVTTFGTLKTNKAG